MDAGHVEIDSKPVNLSELIEEWLDDLGALPDSPDVKIEKSFPPELYVAGEKRYTSLIVQNVSGERAQIQSPRRSNASYGAERGWRSYAAHRQHRPANRAGYAKTYFRAISPWWNSLTCFGTRARFESGPGVGPITRRRFAIGALGRRLDRV